MFKAPGWKVAEEGGALFPKPGERRCPQRPTERALREETGKEGTAPGQVISVLTVC